MANAPDPMPLHPIPGHERLVIGRYRVIASKVRFLMSVDLVTEHARTIMAGDPAALERIAGERSASGG